MEINSQVASFIRARIAVVGVLSEDKAKRFGLDSLGILNEVQRGRARLPFEKIGAVARLLKTDPFELWTMCMKEYQPATWHAISPFMEVGLTGDERRLINNLRCAVSGPYLAALTDESRMYFEQLLESLHCHKTIQ